MVEIQTDVEIDAPSETVWKRWPTWDRSRDGRPRSPRAGARESRVQALKTNVETGEVLQPPE